MKPWIQTVGATYLDLLNPTVEQVQAIGVGGFAVALSHLNRFTGWVGQYSVALHSVNVMSCVIHELGRPDLALPALWHDGAEAATGDISTPMKWALGAARHDINVMTARLDHVIAEAFGIPTVKTADHAVIKKADLMVLRAEREHFMLPLPAEREADWTAHYAGVEPATKVMCFLRPPRVAARLFFYSHYEWINR